MDVPYPYREGRSEGLSASPNSETGQPRNWRSQSAAELTIDPHKLTSSCPDMRRVSTFSSDDYRGETPRSSLGAEESSVDSDDISRSPSRTSRTSCSSVDMPDVLALIPVLSKEDHHQFSSPPIVLVCFKLWRWWSMHGYQHFWALQIIGFLTWLFGILGNMGGLSDTGFWKFTCLLSGWTVNDFSRKDVWMMNFVISLKNP